MVAHAVQPGGRGVSRNMKQVDKAYRHRDGDTDEYQVLLRYPVTHCFLRRLHFHNAERWRQRSLKVEEARQLTDWPNFFLECWPKNRPEYVLDPGQAPDPSAPDCCTRLAGAAAAPIDAGDPTLTLDLTCLTLTSID